MTTGSDWRLPFPTGREQFHHVFHQGIFSDVKIIVEDGVDCSEVDKEVIPSHSFVLKVRSPVFESLLEKVPLNLGFKEVRIQGFKVSDVKKFIQFLYTDQLEASTTQEVQQVLQLAKKYEVHGLVAKSISSLMSELSVQNASSTFQIAKELNEIELETKALQFILSNATEIVSEQDFTCISQHNLCTILASDDLDIKEVELFFGILRWAKVECSRYKIQDSPKHIRLVLKEALSLIRFPLMGRDDFIGKIVPTNILNEREVTEITRYLDAVPENRQFVTPALFSCKPRMYADEEDQLDLTRTDEEMHKRLAKFALKKYLSSDLSEREVELFKNIKTLPMSSVIVEIGLGDSVDGEEFINEIFKIKKYGLHWGAHSVDKAKSTLLLSFATNEDRAFGVGSIIEEIQDSFPDKIKTMLVKSYKECVLVNLSF